MRVPVNEPVITPEAKQYVMDTLEKGWISSGGPYLEKFERAFADFVGVKHAVTTCNGTAALHLALATLHVGKGDEVIVPAFTMMSTVLAVLYTGARPVFVDAERETFNINTDAIAGAITKKTKVILPVHIYGHSVDMDPVIALAKKHDLKIVEDAAEAHGAEYKGRKCGSMGDINCFSFYGNKIVSTGEGGIIVTDDDHLARRARSLKDLAHSPRKRFWHEEMGYNYRMTSLQAACGLGQLEHVQEFIEKKVWMDQEYRKHLSGIPGLTLPVTKPWAKNVFWMYAILVDTPFPLTKDELRARLLERGIDTRDFFYSAARQPIVEKLIGKSGSFPVTEYLEDHGLYLPSGLALTEEQIEEVCRAIHAIAKESASEQTQV